jgi:hypothetical protein
MGDRHMAGRLIAIVVALAVFGVSQAHATFTVSRKPTKHVTCTAGVCSSGNSENANLNASDLSVLLTSSDVKLVSGAAAGDIEFDYPVGWTTHRLTIDSWRAVTVNALLGLVSGGLTIDTNQGAQGPGLSFSDSGHVFVEDPGSSLVINGISYTPVLDLPALASAIGANPGGNFALAFPYDAGPDGVYTSVPIAPTFTGHFEALGNAIENLQIDMRSRSFTEVGLFSNIAGGTVADLPLVNETVHGGRKSHVGGLAGVCEGNVVNSTVSGDVEGVRNSLVGGLCGIVSGTLSGDRTSGTVRGTSNSGHGQNYVGGLAGQIFRIGAVFNSSSTAAVSGAKVWFVGGLAGMNRGVIDSSFAAGTVTADDFSTAGGFVANNLGPHSRITNSYATGSVTGGSNTTVGGFIGLNRAPISDAYSSGAVASASSGAVGGFIGSDAGANDLTDTYWDTTTSGQSHGVGNDTAYPGITGLTTEELQAGLPSGFDPAHWAEGAGINGGLPYLLANPPK